MSSGPIARALTDISRAYRLRTGRSLQEISINQEVYDTLQQELYYELDLDELPNDIRLHGISIKGIKK